MYRPIRALLAVTLLTSNPAFCAGDSPAGPSARGDDGPHVVTTTLRSEALERTVTVMIYLPPGYFASARRYPVLYMQDGQYLFDTALTHPPDRLMNRTMNRTLKEHRAWFGDWQLDSRLDALFRVRPDLSTMVVGIASSGGDRTSEYSPWTTDGSGKPGALRYGEFLVNTLKPYVDRTFRTLPDRAHTGIAGSSLGGLAALYVGLRFPEVFSRIAALSPAFGTDDAARRMAALAATSRWHPPARVYADLGTAERAFGPIRPVRDALLRAGFPERALCFRRIVGGAHRNGDWGRRFPAVVAWLYASGDGAGATGDAVSFCYGAG